MTNHAARTPRQDVARTAVTVLLPLALRDYTDGADTAEVAGDTVAAALTDLVRTYPELRRHLYSDAGHLRGYVNVFLNSDEVRGLDRGMDSPITPGDTLMIVPSIAGG
ncbi:MAG: MoaD/ThiS family protein [Longimicrobiales bacterium]